MHFLTPEHMSMQRPANTCVSTVGSVINQKEEVGIWSWHVLMWKTLTQSKYILTPYGSHGTCPQQ